MQIKLRQLLLVIGFGLALLHAYFPLSTNQQLGVLFVTLFTLGIPHGALDFYIDQRINTGAEKKHGYLFLFKYLMNMLVYGLVWYFFAYHANSTIPALLPGFGASIAGMWLGNRIKA